MNTNTSAFAGQFYRDRHRRRYGIPRLELSDEHISVVNERIQGVKLRHRRSHKPLSFYDNYTNEENQIKSKWTIVRQRLPEILTFSESYKPKSVRAQLVLLVALMNKQTNQLLSESQEDHMSMQDYSIKQMVPANVIINMSGRSQIVCLKRIPSEQMIHIDVNGLSFSIPTRQFIFAVSRGDAHQTAVRYCPPAIRDMLIDLSKIKVIEDRQLYRRIKIKMFVGKILFFVIFIFIVVMMLALIFGVTDTMFKLDSLQPTVPHTSTQHYVYSQSEEILSL